MAHCPQLCWGGGGGGSGGRLRRLLAPFLSNVGAQCIPVDKLENRTLASSASACVLPALACNPGPKRASSAEPPGSRVALRDSRPTKGTTAHSWDPGRPRQGLKALAPRQAGKVCRKGSSWAPPLRAPGSDPGSSWPWSPGHRQAPGRSRGCLRRWGGGVRDPPEPPPLLPASCARPPSPEVTGKQLD